MSTPGLRGRALPRADGLTLAIVAIALLGAGLALAREAVHGVALHLDSIQYVGTARALLAGDGFLRLNGHVYDAWAPLYPLLLVAASFGTLDPLDVAGPLNAIAFGLTICVAGCWMRRRLASRLLVAWTCLAVALAVPLSRVASAALSEATFILLTTLALFHADAFLREGRRAALMWAAVFTALACLAHYRGIPLIPAVALLLAVRGGGPLPGRVRLALGWALAAATPIVLWMLRNAAVTGNPAADRGPPLSLTDVVHRCLDDMSRWWVLEPLGKPGDAALALTGAFLAVLALAALAGFRRQRAPAWFGTVHLLAVYAVVYVLFFWVAGSVVLTGDSLRYYLPVYVPLVVMAAVACDRFVHLSGARRPRGRLRPLALPPPPHCLRASCSRCLSGSPTRFPARSVRCSGRIPSTWTWTHGGCTPLSCSPCGRRRPAGRRFPMPPTFCGPTWTIEGTTACSITSTSPPSP